MEGTAQRVQIRVAGNGDLCGDVVRNAFGAVLHRAHNACWPMESGYDGFYLGAGTAAESAESLIAPCPDRDEARFAALVRAGFASVRQRIFAPATYRAAVPRVRGMTKVLSTRHQQRRWSLYRRLQRASQTMLHRAPAEHLGRLTRPKWPVASAQVPKEYRAAAATSATRVALAEPILWRLNARQRGEMPCTRSSPSMVV